MSSPPRLAVITTHPIQYYAPLFRALAERRRIELRVFYGWGGAAGRATHDHGFGVAFEWDVPLLAGHDHVFVENTSDDPGTHHADGIVAPSLVPEVEVFRPDAVLVFGWNYDAHRKVMRAFNGRVPVLFRGDSTLLDERGGLTGLPRRLARRLALRWIYRDVDLAVTVGTRNREYFLAHGLRPDQLVWAPHAVDNDRFADPTGEREAEAAVWRRDLGVPEHGRVALFAGKLESKKAPEVLLDAVLHLHRQGRGEGLNLAFCGTGPLEGALREAAGGRPGIHFLGFQNQSHMPTAYRLGDVLVLPSRGPGETWGLAVNEAMASGRPAIVTDRVGCAPDLICTATGRVVPTGDVGALSGALAEVLAPGVSERMGAAAAERIRAWSIPEAAVRVEAAVYRALGRPVQAIPEMGPPL